MSASRFAVTLVAAFGALTTSVQPAPDKAPGSRSAGPEIGRDAPAAHASPRSLDAEPSTPWPPALAAEGPADIEARLELGANGARRLVVKQTGTFMHLRYREVTSGGPDWAAIELRAGDKPPPADVAVWESTDPHTLVTRRGLVRFSLAGGAPPEATAAAAPLLGARATGGLHTCQSHADGESGFAVVCRIGKGPSAVRAIRPASKKPLSRAWVWDVPRAAKSADPKSRAERFARIDLPLSPGGADGGAIAYVHGGKGVVLRAEATWPSAAEAPAILLTETSRAQPVSPFFDWSAPRGGRR